MKINSIRIVCVIFALLSASAIAAELTLKPISATILVKEPLTTVKEPVTTATEPAPTVTIRVPATSISIKEPITTIKAPVTGVLVKEPVTTITIREPVTAVTVKEPVTVSKDPATRITIKEPATAINIKEPVAGFQSKNPAVNTGRDIGKMGALKDKGKLDGNSLDITGQGLGTNGAGTGILGIGQVTGAGLNSNLTKPNQPGSGAIGGISTSLTPGSGSSTLTGRSVGGQALANKSGAADSRVSSGNFSASEKETLGSMGISTEGKSREQVMGEVEGEIRVQSTGDESTRNMTNEEVAERLNKEAKEQQLEGSGVSSTNSDGSEKSDEQIQAELNAKAEKQKEEKPTPPPEEDNASTSGDDDRDAHAPTAAEREQAKQQSQLKSEQARQSLINPGTEGQGGNAIAGNLQKGDKGDKDPDPNSGSGAGLTISPVRAGNPTITGNTQPAPVDPPGMVGGSSGGIFSGPQGGSSGGSQNRE